MFKQVVLVASLIVSGIALAEDAEGWVSINANLDGSAEDFINTARVKVVDSKSRTVSFWLKTEYRISTPDTDKAGIEVGGNMVSKNLARCSDRNLKSINTTIYNKNGKAKETLVLKDAEWFDPLPNSIGEREIIVICHMKYPT